jgi:hypothetical protein
MGVISGTVGINYAHELMHQKSRLERGWPIFFWPPCFIRISGPNICAFITCMSAPRATR